MGIMNWFRRKPSARGICSGGAGHTPNTAVVIHVASTLEGIEAEYDYVEGVCGPKDVDWTLGMQMSISREGKNYDVLKVTLKDGTSRSFWFDISAFFGKL